MPKIGYLFPYILCAKDLFDKLDDVLKSVLSAYGDISNKHLVAFRLPPGAFEDMSSRPEWAVYVVLGANDSLPKGRGRLIEYGWDVDVLPPNDALVCYRLLETNNPDKSDVAIGTVRSDGNVDWQYLEERTDADSYFWIRVVENNIGEGGVVS